MPSCTPSRSAAVLAGAEKIPNPSPTSLRTVAPYLMVVRGPARQSELRKPPRSLALVMSLLLGAVAAMASLVAFPGVLRHPSSVVVARASAHALADRERRLDLLESHLAAAKARKPPKLPAMPKFKPVHIRPVTVRYVQPSVLMAAGETYEHKDEHKGEHHDEHKDEHKDEHHDEHPDEHPDEHVDGP
jgi:hypothetical protein